MKKNLSSIKSRPYKISYLKSPKKLLTLLAEIFMFFHRRLMKNGLQTNKTTQMRKKSAKPEQDAGQGSPCIRNSSRGLSRKPLEGHVPAVDCLLRGVHSGFQRRPCSSGFQFYEQSAVSSSAGNVLASRRKRQVPDKMAP